MNNYETININETKFLKASKKLQQSFNNEFKIGLKLSKIQEFLAQSLGFRNLNALQNFLATSKNQNLTKNQPSITFKKSSNNIFDIVDLDGTLHIFVSLMEKTNNNDMWTARAISLLSSVMPALIYMKEQGDIILNSKVIYESLSLSNLISLQKRKDLPDNVIHPLKTYFSSLPGYMEDTLKQSEVAYENHNYLQTQFLPVINKLHKIEEDDFIIFDKSWLHENLNYKIMSALDYYKQEATEKNTANQMSYLNTVIEDLDFIEDTWLFMPEYIEFVSSLLKRNQLRNIKVSDLLLYITTIISPYKMANMILVLNSIVDNYSVATQISAKICAKLNE